MSESFAAYANLPDAQKRQLCIELLAEFGVSQFNETRKGELQHQCTLPLGGHTDRDSVTASINYRKLTFACFVCGNKGGLLWWIAVNRHESVEQARNWLRNASGVTDGIDPQLLLGILDELFHPPREQRVIPSYDLRILDQWTSWPIHHPYLTDPVRFVDGRNIGGREIPIETLDRYRIGYCDHDADWRYRQRIIIPLFWRAKLVGWQARRLDPNDPDPAKYKNSPDAPRDRILYGAVEEPEIVLVESPMSVLRHVHRLPLVATLGAVVSEFQLPLLHHYRRITVWPDNDKAGWDALTGTGFFGRRHEPGLIDKLRDYVEVRVVQSPWSKADPADLTEEQALDLVEQAVPAAIWHPPDLRDLAPYRRGAA